MANPLARAMMDRMSKKNGKEKTNNYGQTPERLSNLGKQEEALLSGVIRKTVGTPEVVGSSGKSNHQGKNVQLQDLVKNTSGAEEKSREKSLKGDNNQGVKNPYQPVEVKTSVIANPGKGVAAVSLKSLGKGNTP